MAARTSEQSRIVRKVKGKEARAHMGPEGPSNFIKKLKGSVLAIFFFVVT